MFLSTFRCGHQWVVQTISANACSAQIEHMYRWTMTPNFDLRRAQPADAPSMARVHVDSWRETYRGLMSDAVLDDPALLSWRERFWAAALTDPKYNQNNIAVASYDGTIIGIAMSGPSLDDDAQPQKQLHVLYS